MMTNLEQQIRELAASRMGQTQALGNGPVPEDTSPTIYYWLDQVRESLAELDNLAQRSESLALNICGMDNRVPREESKLTEGSSLYTSIELIAHRLRVANTRFHAALTASERAIGDTNS